MTILRKILFLIYIYQLISIIIHFIKEKILLFPLYTQYISTENIDNIETIYLENDCCVNIFFPEEEEEYKKCLFILNDFNGNANTKYLLVRQLQKIFDSFTIIQLEYPGFGQSFHQTMTISNIMDSCLENINLFLVEKNITEFGIFAERFGSSVITHLLEKDIKPKFILYYNPIHSFYHSSLEIVPILFQPFMLPLLLWKCESEKSNRIKTFIMNTSKYERDALEKYTKLKNKNVNVFLLELKGKENFGLLIQENQKKLKSFLKDVL